VVCWDRSESGVNVGNVVVRSLLYSELSVFECVGKCLLNVIRVGWRFEILTL